MQLQPALCFAALLLRPSNDFFHRFLGRLRCGCNSWWGDDSVQICWLSEVS